jgi:hypothetical protein
MTVIVSGMEPLEGREGKGFGRQVYCGELLTR